MYKKAAFQLGRPLFTVEGKIVVSVQSLSALSGFVEQISDSQRNFRDERALFERSELRSLAEMSVTVAFCETMSESRQH